MVSLKGILGYQFFVWLAVSATIVFICFCAVSKIQRLNASYAIRRGNWKTKEISRKKQKNTYYNGKGSFELYYAIKGIWNKKLRDIYNRSIYDIQLSYSPLFWMPECSREY